MNRITKRIKANDSDTINIKFKGLDSLDVYYNSKKSSSIKELYESFCELKNINKSVYELTFKGEVIQENSTIDECNINEDDTIIVRKATLIDHEYNKDNINIIFKYTNFDFPIVAKKFCRIETYKEILAKTKGFCVDSIKLLYNDVRIEDHFSVSYLNMSNGDCIDVVLALSGA